MNTIINLTFVNTTKNVQSIRRKTKLRKSRLKKTKTKNLKTIESLLNQLMQIRNLIIRIQWSKHLLTIKLNVNNLPILIRKRIKIKVKRFKIQAVKFLHRLKQPKKGVQKIYSTIKMKAQLLIKRIGVRSERILRMPARHNLLYKLLKLIGKLKMILILSNLKQ